LGAWLLARRRKEAAGTDQARPRSAHLYGPDGELLKTVLVEDDEPVIVDPGAGEEWPRPLD
jgi:hypothetical protein